MMNRQLVKPPEPDPENTFLLNPEYYIVTGAKRNRIGARTHHNVALIMIVISALAVVWAISQWITESRRSQEMNRTALPTRATVTDKRFEDTGRTVPDRYFVTYRFSVDGRDYERQIEVPQNVYERLAVGNELAIKYAVGHPALSTLYELDIAPPNTDFVLLVALVPTVLAVLSVLIALLITVRNIRYDRRGRPIQGEVLSSKGEDMGGKYYVTVSYRFRTPENKQIEGKFVRVRDDLRNGPLPKVGDPVAILYVTDRMYRLL